MKVGHQKNGIILFYKSFEAQQSINAAKRRCNVIRVLLNEITGSFKVPPLHQHLSVAATATANTTTPASTVKVQPDHFGHITCPLLYNNAIIRWPA